jgi:signal transduction histidine kinase
VTPPLPTRATEEFEALFDRLLYAVSHDLKTPLLSVSLGAELLGEAGTDAARAALGLDSITRGAEDMTRLLDALTALSRARRRPLDDASVALVAVLPGVPAAPSVRVSVDARLPAEMLAALECSAERVQVVQGESEVQLVLPWPEGAPECSGPPLEALLEALGRYSGTPVSSLASLQVQLERQGGTVVIVGDVVRVLLPSTTDDSA